MKKFLCLIFVACIATTATAQQHLEFLGHPIQGTIDDFSAAIRQRFPLQKKVGGDCYFIFKGNVYGHDSYFKVEYTRRTKTVYKITVTPKQVDSNALADSLIAHYGTGEQVRGGHRWDRPGGTIFLYVPDGYDPVLMYFDEQGVAKFRAEK